MNEVLCVKIILQWIWLQKKKYKSKEGKKVVFLLMWLDQPSNSIFPSQKAITVTSLCILSASQKYSRYTQVHMHICMYAYTVCVHIILEAYYTLGFAVLCTLYILNILPYQYIAGCRIPFSFFWSRQTPWLNSSCRLPPLEGKQPLKCSNSLCLTTTAGVALFTSGLLEISAGVMYRMWVSTSLDLLFQEFPLNFQTQCSGKGSPWLNQERICQQWRRPRFDPGPQRSPGEGNSNTFQYSCLENPTDRGVWWVTVHSVAKSQIWMKRLSTCS